MSTLKTGALRGTSGSADSIQLHASNQSVTFPGDVNITTKKLKCPGTIIQVVNTTVTDIATYSMPNISNWYDVSLVNCSITPSAATSKIMISVYMYGEGSTTDLRWGIRLLRTESGESDVAIAGATAGSRRSVIGNLPSAHNDDDSAVSPTSYSFAGLIDSPSTTAAVNYKVQMNNESESNHSFHLNRSGDDDDAWDHERGLSWITLQEIVA